MTNPDNIVRVRARNGGRSSVYEANDWAQGFSIGLFQGNGVIQNTPADMNVLVGGSATKPDVVIATNPAGYKIALDLVGQQPIAITAPASNSRISAIVAYTDDLALATSQDNVTGSPASCGLIVVNGSAAASPVAPSDTQIRSAITADGATGSQAAYCVIATIKVASGTSVIDDSLITMNMAGISSQNIDFATIGLGKYHVLNLAVSLPNTAYNGHNTILSTGQKPFSGGVYLLSLPSLMISLNSANYQAYVGYSIDGNLVQVLNFAQMGTNQTLAGSVSFNTPIELPSGNHTVTIEVGTWNATKSITVAEYQDDIKAYLVKVGM